jgi:hypothetical protein
MNELYAMEPWVEQIRPSFDLREIFGIRRGQDKPSDEDLRQRGETSPQEDKEPVWERIRKIFKKK